MKASLYAYLALLVGLLAAPAHGQELRPLVEGQCTRDCDSDIFKKVWLHLEDSTGLRTSVDTASVRYGDQGGFQVVIYTGQPKRMFDAGKLQRLFFNCQGQYQDLGAFPAQLHDFGPLSVAGQIEKRYCDKGVSQAGPQRKP